MGQSEHDPGAKGKPAWNAGRKLGAKRALKPQQVWAIRFWLDSKKRMRDRAMFDLAIDSKLRGCDIVKIKIGDIVLGGRVRSRAIVVQQKTKRPVQFELLDHAQGSLKAWLDRRGGTVSDYVFPSRINHAKPISTRQYARLVEEWVNGIGLRREDYGTHSLRRTVPLRRGTRDLRLRVLARRDRGQSAGGLVRGCPDQAAASRLAGVAGMGFQFHGSSSARRWAGWDAMRPSTSASQA